jgi:hypothetical protein
MKRRSNPPEDIVEQPERKQGGQAVDEEIEHPTEPWAAFDLTVHHFPDFIPHNAKQFFGGVECIGHGWKIAAWFVIVAPTYHQGIHLETKEDRLNHAL